MVIPKAPHCGDLGEIQLHPQSHLCRRWARHHKMICRLAARAAQQRTGRRTQHELLLRKTETTLTAGSSTRVAVHIWCLRIILELIVNQSRIFALRKRTAHGWLRGLEFFEM